MSGVAIDTRVSIRAMQTAIHLAGISSSATICCAIDAQKKHEDNMIQIWALTSEKFDRLIKCLRNFQKIADIHFRSFPCGSFDTYGYFIKLLRVGFETKEALTILKKEIRNVIGFDVYNGADYHKSPSIPESFHIVVKNIEDEKMWLKEDTTPHYRDLEYKHKKKRY